MDFRKLQILIIFSLLSISLSVFSNPIDVTIHVDDAYRPFSFNDKGQAKGMYIDVLKAAFSRMKNFKVNIKTVPWTRGKLLMKNGEALGLAPAFFHGHDWPYLHPYSLPFYTETIVVICQEKILPKNNWPQDYIGLKIGNVTGFDGWGGEEFRKLVKAGKIKYEEVNGTKENIVKLLLNRIDCILMEEKAFEYQFKKIQNTKKHAALAKKAKIKTAVIIGTDPVYIGYSKPARLNNKYPYQFDFMQAFDSEIYKMIKSGEIAKIMNAYTD